MLTVFYLLIAVSLYLVVKVAVSIWDQQKCLSPEDIRDYMTGRLYKDETEYSRVIGHLGHCEKCQQRMRDFDENDNIEDHLVGEE